MQELINVYKERGNDFINDLFDSYVVVTEKLSGSSFAFEKTGQGLHYFKGNSQNPINLIDRTLMVYYEPAIEYITNKTKFILSSIPNNWRFCFQYFVHNEPGIIKYDKLPKNNLVLTHIQIMSPNGKIAKIIDDPRVINDWSNRLDVTALQPVFQGRLSDIQKKQIKNFLDIPIEDQMETFGTSSASSYILSILNPSIKSTLLHNDSSKPIDSFVFKFYKPGETKSFSAKLVDPYTKTLMKNSVNEDPRRAPADMNEIILLDILSFIEERGLRKNEILSTRPDERYLELVTAIFNDYVDKRGSDLKNLDIEKADFVKNDEFNLNLDMIANERAKERLSNNESLRDLYKIMIGSLRKKRDPDKTGVILTPSVIEDFNKMITKIEEIVYMETGEKFKTFSDYLKMKQMNEGIFSQEYFVDSFDEDLNENSGNRGFEFENAIVKGIINLNLTNIRMDGGIAGNNNAISDLGLMVNGTPIAAEVKLSSTDNLGALPKKDVDSIEFDGRRVRFKIDNSSQYKEILNDALSALNTPKILSTLKNIYDKIEPYLDGPMDLTKTLGSLRGDEIAKNIFNEVSQSKKQFTGPADVKVNPETIRRLISKKNGPNGAPTDYIIIGNNNHKKVEGSVYHLGNNPLGIDVPMFNPTGVYVEMRIQRSGSVTKKTAAYSFGMKTKNSGKMNKGRTFSNVSELASIFLGNELSKKKMNESIFNNDTQVEEVIKSKIEERRRTKGSIIDVDSLPDSIKDTAIKEGKIEQLISFFNNLPEGEGRDAMFNLLNQISNNQREVDFFINNLWTKNGPTPNGKIDINPNDYKEGTLGYKIFQLKPAGMGRGELLFAWRIKDSEIQGGSVNFDLMTPNGKFEVKDYRNKKEPKKAIRLGVKGKAPQYRFFRQILETISLIEKMTGVDTLADKYQFNKSFNDIELLDLINKILERSVAIRTGEFNKGDRDTFRTFYEKISKVEYTPNVYVKAILRGPGGEPFEINIEPLNIEDVRKNKIITINKADGDISTVDSILAEFRRLRYVRNPMDLDKDLQDAVNTAVGDIPIVVFRNDSINVTRDFVFSHVSQSGIFILERSVAEK